MSTMRACIYRIGDLKYHKQVADFHAYLDNPQDYKRGGDKVP
jgi:hypothetical protein